MVTISIRVPRALVSDYKQLSTGGSMRALMREGLTLYRSVLRRRQGTA
jgi:hypothetical protein